MKINAIDIKPGNVLEHSGKLWIVLKRELIQPGKGGAFAQVEMRDLKSGNKTNERYRTQETVERVQLDEKEMQFLYIEGDHATFMDNETYEQITVDRELIGEPADFLKDNMMVTVQLYEGTPLSVTLPQIGDHDGGRGRCGGEGPDRVLLLQARQARERPARDDPAPHRRRHPHRRQHRRRLLRRARQGLSAGRAAPRSTAHGRPLRPHQRDDLGRPQGGARPDPRLRRGRAAAGLRQGPRRFRLAADLKAEKTLRAELAKARPGFGFLMEESGASAGSDGRHRWIVDPLDGTTNFLHGMPHFCISIGLERDGEIVAGVIYEPVRDEMFWGEKGAGAFVNDRRLRVSARRQLGEAVIATGIPSSAAAARPCALPAHARRR